MKRRTAPEEAAQPGARIVSQADDVTAWHFQAEQLSLDEETDTRSWDDWFRELSPSMLKDGVEQ